MRAEIEWYPNWINTRRQRYRIEFPLSKAYSVRELGDNLWRLHENQHFSRQTTRSPWKLLINCYFSHLHRHFASIQARFVVNRERSQCMSTAKVLSGLCYSIGNDDRRNKRLTLIPPSPSHPQDSHEKTSKHRVIFKLWNQLGRSRFVATLHIRSSNGLYLIHGDGWRGE